MVSAIEFGEKHKSCAMGWRRSLGIDATQSDAYLACERGDHLIWQLRKLPKSKLQKVIPALLRAVDKIVARAKNVGAPYNVVSTWAVEAAVFATRAAAYASKAKNATTIVKHVETALYFANCAARDTDLKRQAIDIRSEIPEWPGE